MSVLSPHQRELMKDLSDAGVLYVVVGGKAMQAHGLKRASQDLDLWVSPDTANVERLLPLLVRRVTEPVDLTSGWLAQPGRKVALQGAQEGDESEVLTSMHNLDFNDVFSRSRRLHVDGLDVLVASIEDLACIKQLNIDAGQDAGLNARDLADLRMLEDLAARDSGGEMSEVEVSRDSSDADLIQALNDNERRALGFIASQADGLLETHIESALATYLSMRERDCLRIMMRLSSDNLIVCQLADGERRYKATIDGVPLDEELLQYIHPEPVYSGLEMPNSTHAMTTLSELFLNTKGTLFLGMEVSTPDVFPQLGARASKGYRTVLLMPRKKDVPKAKHVPYDECIEKWRRFVDDLPKSQSKLVSIRVTALPHRPIYTSALSSDLARFTLYSYDAGTTRGGQMISATRGSSMYHLIETQFAHAMDGSLPRFQPFELALALSRRYLLHVVIVVLLVAIAVFGLQSGLGALALACLTALAADVARGVLLWAADRDQHLF